VGLALEGKLGEIMNLGEEIQWQIGLPESNFVALVQENLPEPRLEIREVETAYSIGYQEIFIDQGNFIQVNQRRNERILFLFSLLCLRHHFGNCTCNKQYVSGVD
jgi:hypothetical protein